MTRTTARSMLFAGVVLAGSATALDWSAALNAQPGRVYRIGLITALSGWSAAFAGEVRVGAQLAVDEVNLAGGVGGRRLELVVKDDWTSLEASVKAFNELVASGVTVILGPDTTEGALATIPLALKRNVLQILPTAQTNDERGHADDNTIFLYPPLRAEEVATAKFAQERFKARRVAIINPDDPFGEARSRLLREELRKVNIEVAADERFKQVQGDFSPHFKRILGAQPDLVVFPAFLFERSAQLIQQARAAGIRAPLIGEGAACSLTLDILLRGDPVDQLFFVNEQFSREFRDNAVMQRFIEAYEPRAYVANPLGAAGHSAVMLVRDALAARATTPRAMKAHIQSSKKQTALGTLAFDQNGDNTGVQYGLFQLNPEARITEATAAAAQKASQLILVR